MSGVDVSLGPFWCPFFDVTGPRGGWSSLVRGQTWRPSRAPRLAPKPVARGCVAALDSTGLAPSRCPLSLQHHRWRALLSGARQQIAGQLSRLTSSVGRLGCGISALHSPPTGPLLLVEMSQENVVVPTNRPGTLIDGHSASSRLLFHLTWRVVLLSAAISASLVPPVAAISQNALFDPRLSQARPRSPPITVQAPVAMLRPHRALLRLSRSSSGRLGAPVSLRSFSPSTPRCQICGAQCATLMECHIATRCYASPPAVLSTRH